MGKISQDMLVPVLVSNLKSRTLLIPIFVPVNAKILCQSWNEIEQYLQERFICHPYIRYCGYIYMYAYVVLEVLCNER